MSFPLPVRFVYASVDDREVVLRLGWSDRATEADPSTTYSATYVLSPRTALEMRGLLDELLTVYQSHNGPIVAEGEPQVVFEAKRNPS